MAVSTNILGMNARNFLYIRKYNKPSAKMLADDKLATKKRLLKHGIATPPLLGTFYDRDEIRSFDWSSLPANGFVIKPARGYGGGGILPIKKWENNIAVTVSGEEYTLQRLESHLLDILDGAYSLQFLPDKAFIEERVIPDPFFKKLGAIGLPDIRIITFNKIPIMSMLRLPTPESKGKANLHQGALALGIDIRTGITTSGVYRGKPITFFPGTKVKVRGIRIPNWNDLLLLAARTQGATRLGYGGCDIVIDAKSGPLVLEVNARPGLAIQVANQASLRTRLERVENMSISTPERGVEVGKSLFAEAFSEKVQTAPRVLSIIEPVILKNGEKVVDIKAKLDTGAFRSSIDYSLVKELRLEVDTDRTVRVASASGKTHRRPTTNVTFELGGKKVSTIVSVTDREHLKYPMIIGYRDLRGFLVSPDLLKEDERFGEELDDDDH